MRYKHFVSIMFILALTGVAVRVVEYLFGLG